PWAFRTARSSEARAPQAMTRGATVMPCSAASGHRRAGRLGLQPVAARLHESLCGLGGHCCVTAIGIGTDGVTELFIEWRTADQHEVLLAQPFFDERVD